MICNKCGNKVSKKDKVCPKCNALLQAPDNTEHSAVYPSLINYCAAAKKSFIMAILSWVLLLGTVGLGIPTLLLMAEDSVQNIQFLGMNINEGVIVILWFLIFVACLAVCGVNLVAIKNLFGSYFLLDLPNEIDMHAFAKKQTKIAFILTLPPAILSYLLLFAVMAVIFVPGLKLK